MKDKRLKRKKALVAFTIDSLTKSLFKSIQDPKSEALEILLCSARMYGVKSKEYQKALSDYKYLTEMYKGKVE